MAGNKNSLKTIAQNKKAYHDYFVVESMEAVLNCAARK